MTDPNIPTKEAEVIRLIEADHKATTEFISRLTTLRGAVRTVVVTLGSTLAGLAFTQNSWVIAIVGIPVILFAAIAEARTDFLIQVAHNRSVRLEHKIQSYIAHLLEDTGAVAKDAAAKFQREMDTYQFGTSRSLRRSSVWKALAISAKNAAFWLYPTVAALLIAVAITMSLGTSSKASPSRSDVSSPTQVRL
jgi:type IV secretory pathway TrbD component